MFDLDEHSSASPSKAQRLDVERTFSPRPKRLNLTIKFFLFFLIVAVTVQSISQKTHPDFWLAYLTHWGVVFSLAYISTSVGSAVYLHLRPPANTGVLEGGLGLLLKTTWALFAIAFPAEIVITILFWLLEFDGNLKYVSVMVHGGFAALLLIDGLLLSRIPLRMKQLLLSQAFCFFYILWGGIHAYSGIGNPYKDDGTQDDDAIYGSIAWKAKPIDTTILVVGVFFLVNPIVFLVCRLLSRLLPRRLVRGEENEQLFKGGKSSRNDEEAGGGYIEM